MQDTERRKASRRLHAMDSAAEFVVTAGGLVVLAAVLGICFYLAWVVMPLFVGGGHSTKDAGVVRGVVPLRVVMDPYGQSAGLIGTDGVVRTLVLPNGDFAGEIDLRVDNMSPSAVAIARNGELAALGYPDGRVQLGSFLFASELLDSIEALQQDERRVETLENGYVEHIATGRRRVVLEHEFGDLFDLKEGTGAVRGIDFRVDPGGKKILVALREDGTVLVSSVRTIRPLGGGTPRTKLRSSVFKMEGREELPGWIFVTGDGKYVLLIWSDGQLQRYAKQGRKFGMVEEVSLSAPGVGITDAKMLLGAKTLVIGEDSGTVSAFHVGDDSGGRTSDGKRMVRAHEMKSADGAVVRIAVSGRDRTIAVLHKNGYVDVRYVTSEKHITRYKPEIARPGILAIAPKNDGVFVLGDDGAYQSEAIEVGYPEFSVRAVFGKVLYEGQSEPAYVYQSSSGDDASEVKLSLMPLIFGTMKATVFAMLFAIPVAVFAAMYSSEFMSGRVRSVVKPSVELMASLPSVVLGFIAAMVAAPFVQAHLASLLLGIFVVPLTVLVAAHLWQMVPMARRRRIRSGQHFALALLALLIGGLLSSWVGPGIVRAWFTPDDFDVAMMAGAYEPVPLDSIPQWASGGDDLTVHQQRKLRSLGFGLVDGVVVRPAGSVDRDAVLGGNGLGDGDLERWLNDEYGSAKSGWILVLFPPAAMALWLVQGVALRRKLDGWLVQKESLFVAMVMFGKLLAICFGAFIVALIGASVLGRMGFDPRDSIFGTFSPRNTLVVSIIMGFAVIPIIFTISEDALRAVPNTLRSASLGAGATPWQTTVRVVLPVAGSGIFSACMIGFGRAVGETMIVLMATGNTAEMSWNIFSGFRTLAANIAVEIPEAPKDETHYRVLFLCGLTLFLMTFVINTLAEGVRRYVRGRNAGL
ncbi:MAG: ABC transporter permease subunit [Phycisphaerales bacterium]|nr:ABC transporter permease subunit [Phycisphaerales bacterium]